MLTPDYKTLYEQMKERHDLLRVRYEETREELRQLKQSFRNQHEWIPPHELQLTPAHATVLAALFHAPAGQYVSTEVLHVASQIYNRGGDIDKQTDPKIVDVYICKIRKKLIPYGLEIKTVWGRGYQLTEESKHKLRNWYSEEPQAA